MTDEIEKESDSLGDQMPGTQRGEGSQTNSEDESRPGANPEGEGVQQSGAGGPTGKGPMAKIVRKIAWSMRFLP
jgi:hypothetical protein